MATKDERIEPWIGVDLDGTLAHYDGWKGIEHIGSPIELMIKRILRWIDEGKNVKIFTARIAKDQDGYTVEQIITIIEDWSFEHIGFRLEVTCTKDFGMVELWDDRCFRVVTNTGERCCDN